MPREFFDRPAEAEDLHQARAGRHAQGAEQQQHRARARQYHRVQFERGLARRGADRAARVHDREHTFRRQTIFHSATTSSRSTPQ